MSTRQIELEVMRYDPDKDKEPWFQQYSVPCEEDWAILDALNYVKENIDTTLSYRWSCHMMVCGSCGMMINGEPSLTCKVFIRDLPDNVRVEPLENFPIERDLVVVLDDVVEKLNRVQPYIIRKDDPPPETEEYNQSRSAPCAVMRHVRSTGSIVILLARPRWHWHTAITSIPATRESQNAWISLLTMTGSGNAHSSAPVPRSARRMWIRQPLSSK
jgi:fumarate reductase iron-sulfur subunit